MSVVIAIVSSLMVVVVLAVRGISDNGREISCAHHRRVAATAAESYFATQEITDAAIRDASAYYDVTADGSLVAEPGSPCS